MSATKSDNRGKTQISYISLDDLTELLDGRAEGPDNEKLFDMTKLINDGLEKGKKEEG